MMLPFNNVMLVTRRPWLCGRVQEVLRRAGVDGEPVFVHDSQPLEALKQYQSCLVMIDANCVPSLYTLAQMAACAPESCFVLYTRRVTPDLLRVALEAGLHGVLSTGLPVDDAAQALTRICLGERLFRFDSSKPSSPKLPVVPPVSPADFDAQWMFGN